MWEVLSVVVGVYFTDVGGSMRGCWRLSLCMSWMSGVELIVEGVYLFVLCGRFCQWLEVVTVVYFSNMGSSSSCVRCFPWYISQMWEVLSVLLGAYLSIFVQCFRFYQWW